MLGSGRPDRSVQTATSSPRCTTTLASEVKCMTLEDATLIVERAIIAKMLLNASLPKLPHLSPLPRGQQDALISIIRELFSRLKTATEALREEQAASRRYLRERHAAMVQNERLLGELQKREMALQSVDWQRRESERLLREARERFHSLERELVRFKAFCRCNGPDRGRRPSRPSAASDRYLPGSPPAQAHSGIPAMEDAGYSSIDFDELGRVRRNDLHDAPASRSSESVGKHRIPFEADSSPASLPARLGFVSIPYSKGGRGC
ncbi:hypothetical protein DFJ73DRAFT_853716 [Zopfochytrium polystomum]|nr:hypothetical protein DFJ73DRAFT_853716 [Zopfochytrium polystomum]